MLSMLPPNGHAAALLVLAVLAFAAFSRERLPLESTSLIILVALVGGFAIFPFVSEGQTVSPTFFFRGFGHEALVAICSLMILGRGLVVTGALQPVARILGKALETRPRLALLAVLVLCAMLSGVLNDTPVVVLMMPILVSASLKAGKSPSESLMPMNYAVLIGGMSTTIGTSTNLLVTSIAADLGVRNFGVFDFTHVAAIAALGGLAYCWFVLPLLLPNRASPLSEVATQIFDAVLYIDEDSPAVGTSLRDVRAQAGRQVEIRKVIRDKGLELVRLPTLELKAGDRIHVRAAAADLHELASHVGATLHNVDDDEPKVDDIHPLKQTNQILADAVVTETSSIHGRTLKEARFAEHNDVIVLGLHRPAGYQLSSNDEISTIRLTLGDILLVQGTLDSIDRLNRDAGLLILERKHDVRRTSQAPIALAILGLVVLASAFKIVPISVAALSGVLAMIVTRCLDWTEAFAALSGKIILLVVASLALGAGLTKTGATDYLASLLIAGTKDASPHTVLVVLMVFMAVFTNFVSNNAAAAIGTPIAVSIATKLNLSPEPLVLAILFGANFCYVTPMAYQTNLLIMSAGGYQFSDFVRGGLPLALLMLSLYAILLPWFFPF